MAFHLSVAFVVFAVLSVVPFVGAPAIFAIAGRACAAFAQLVVVDGVGVRPAGADRLGPVPFFAVLGCAGFPSSGAPYLAAGAVFLVPSAVSAPALDCPERHPTAATKADGRSHPGDSSSQVCPDDSFRPGCLCQDSGWVPCPSLAAHDRGILRAAGWRRHPDGRGSQKRVTRGLFEPFPDAAFARRSWQRDSG